MNYIKMSPMVGLSGYGGGATGLGFVGGATGTGTWYGSRGCFGGGYTGNDTNDIDKVEIDTTGDATDFGDLTMSRQYIASGGDGSRGLFMGGGIGSGAPRQRTDSIEIGTLGNASDFGDPINEYSSMAGVCDGLYALSAGGWAPLSGSTEQNVIQYYVVQVAGNATDFSDLTQARRLLGSVNDATRGVFAAGYSDSESPENLNTIDYITMANIGGNATDFGDYSSNMAYLSGCSSETRGVWALGHSGSAYSNTAYYVTIQTLSNTSTFGSMTEARFAPGCSSNATRGIWGGGKISSGGTTDTIDYLTLDTTGNGSSFGDLNTSRQAVAGVSGT